MKVIESCCCVKCLCVSCVFQMCERCNRRTECTKRLSIQRFPQVIVIRILGNNSYPLYYEWVMFMCRMWWWCLTASVQIWIVSRPPGGRSVKAQYMSPSHSLTWTSDPTDPSTVVTPTNFFLYLFRFITFTHVLFVFICMISSMFVSVCHLFILRMQERLKQRVCSLYFDIWQLS